MADNQLTISNGEFVTLTNGCDISTVIKPLVKEIHLFDSYVSGTSHLKDKSVYDEIQEGCRLTMRRENNKFDDNAIMLIAPSGKNIGYVPEADNIIFARLLDAGKMLVAYVRDFQKVSENFMKINIGIYLVDF